VAAWLLFAGYFASMVPYFIFEQKSVVEGLATIVAVPLSVAVGYHLYRGRDSLFVL
jgi:hypothetical protein